MESILYAICFLFCSHINKTWTTFPVNKCAVMFLKTVENSIL